MLTLITLLAPALASPDRLTATFELGSKLTALAPSADGRWVGAVEGGSDELRVLDTLTWDASAFDSLANQIAILLTQIWQGAGWSAPAATARAAVVTLL